MPTTGENIRAMRLDRGLSQAALAEKAGITDRTLRRAECDQQVESATLNQIAAALGVRPLDLIGSVEDGREAKANDSARQRLDAILAGPYAPLGRAMVDTLYEQLTIT